MGKGKLFTFGMFAALGAIAGYTTYMINKNEFSDDTKNEYDKVLNKIKNVGTDIKRTYTSIGDKDEFTNNSKNLGSSTMKLFKTTRNLVASATSDMYNNAKEKIKSASKNVKSDDSSYDDLDDAYIQKKKKSKKNIKVKKVTSKTQKK